MKDRDDSKTREIEMPARPRGRPAIFGDPMTPAEKQRRYRENRVARLRDAAKAPTEATDAQLVDLIRYNMNLTRVTAAARAKIRAAALELAKRYK